MPSELDLDLDFYRLNERYLDLIKKVFRFQGYGDILFPIFSFESKKNPKIVVKFTFNGLKLISYKEDEIEKSGKDVDINYNEIKNLQISNEEKAISFEVKFENGSNKNIKIYSAYVNIKFFFIV